MLGIDGDSSEKPGIEELYEAATNTSNLRQEADRRTAADVLRDMAMSADTLGASLLRLRGQWEAAEKPARQRTRSLKEFIATGLSREDAEAANQEEREQHDEWFEAAMRELLGQLPELPKVRAAVTVQALKWNIESAEEKASAVIRYWLDQTCSGCDGRKFKLIEGTPALSTKVCTVCRGSGVGHVPHGQDGRRLANHMDQCVFRYKQNMKTRRKALASIPPIDRLSKRMQRGGEED